MLAKVSHLLILSLFGHIYCQQFCDLDSFDSVFNIGHLVYFLRCGQIWTYDPRMNGKQGGFLRDWSFYLMAENTLWRANDKVRDFRFSGFSFQELSCMNYVEDLADSCYKSTKKWQHLTALFTNHSVYAFNYITEATDLAKDNPLGFEAGIHSPKPSKNFWPTFPEYNNFPDNLGENYLSILYDPHQEVLYLAMKYHLVNLITHTSMRDAIHNSSHYPINNKDGFNRTWSKPYIFEGHLIGMFFDEKTESSYVVGEVHRENRVYNDLVYALSVGTEKGEVVVAKNEHTDDGFVNLRMYFGCKFSKQENENNMEKKRKRDAPGSRYRRCAQFDDIDDDQIEGDEQTIDNRIDYWARFATQPKVMITLSLLVVSLSSVLLFLYLDLYPKS